MHLKPDAPLRATSKASSKKVLSPVSNEDLMGALKAFKNEMLSANNAIYEL